MFVVYSLWFVVFLGTGICSLWHRLLCHSLVRLEVDWAFTEAKKEAKDVGGDANICETRFFW